MNDAGSMHKVKIEVTVTPAVTDEQKEQIDKIVAEAHQRARLVLNKDTRGC